MAAKLSRNEMRIMVVKGPETTPEFIFSVDALQLHPGEGEFSCCAVNHNFGNGVVPCDRKAVHSVLVELIEAKIDHLQAKGEWF